ATSFSSLHTATTASSTLSLHDALPICVIEERDRPGGLNVAVINETFALRFFPNDDPIGQHFGMTDVSHSGDYKIVGIVEDAKYRSEEHTSELQSRENLVCRLLLEKKKT